MLKVLQNTVKRPALSGFHTCLVLQRCSSLNFKNNYSDEDSSKILKLINENSMENISKYQISKGRIAKMSSWKLKHGPFVSVEQILNVDGFGIKILEKFCDSVLKVNDSNSTLKLSTTKKAPTLSTPKVLEKNRLSIKSCVSVHIGVTNISWCKLNINNHEPVKVTEWNQYEIADKKLHLSDLVQLVMYVNSLLPEADVYVLENPIVAQGGAPKSIIQININLQKSQLVAMVSLILANRKNLNDIDDSSSESDENIVKSQENEKQTVFYLRQYLSSRLFGTFIGNEKVSTEGVVENLLGNHYNEPSSDIGQSLNNQIRVDTNLRELYNESKNVERENLGQSLLLGLAFLRLCILKCNISLQKISR